MGIDEKFMEYQAQKIIKSNSHLKKVIERYKETISSLISDINIINGFKTSNKKQNKFQNENKINVNKYNPKIKVNLVNKENNNQNTYENIINEKGGDFIYIIICIQLWWKSIFQIIKIQKNIRGFLFRNQLIKNLELYEKYVDKVLLFIKLIKKIFYRKNYYYFSNQIFSFPNIS